MSTSQEATPERHYSNHGAVHNPTQPNSHRRSFSHDYHDEGIYMVTLVTENRARLFGHIEGNALATKQPSKTAWVKDWQAPHMVLSELGHRILEEELPKITHYYPQVEVWRATIMPDHLHLLLRVKEHLPEGKHLGHIIRGFKTGCTRAWWALQDAGIMPPSTGKQPLADHSLPSGKALGTTAPTPGNTPTSLSTPFATSPTSVASNTTAASLVSPASTDPRVVAPVPEASPSGSLPLRPLLFSPGYHDRIINRPGMLENIKRYMLENPLRARIREECPHLMERRLHLWIAGREYAAFGNLFLLKYPLKEQVFFHRYTTVDEEERQAILASGNLTEKERSHISTDPQKMPTHLTAFFATERTRLLSTAEEGTVLITPGISKGESIIANAAIDAGLPLILLQALPIGQYWKPEQRRFYACAQGHLLILSPWELEGETDYEHFHRLNDLASELCNATEMRIMDYTMLKTL
ncbi:MAG: hypothetical protein J5545_00710 [Bacteroidaceae bacterium]|nr:hypothetical protein [Bacteroidaceae bacterium]